MLYHGLLIISAAGSAREASEADPAADGAHHDLRAAGDRGRLHRATSGEIPPTHRPYMPN